MVSLAQSCGCATTYVLMRRSHGWPLIMDVLVLYILESEFFLRRAVVPSRTSEPIVRHDRNQTWQNYPF